MPALVTVWGLRLGIHILVRSRGKGEDRRYAAMRERRGASFVWLSLFSVFWLQAALLVFVSLPLLAAIGAREPAGFGALDAAGAVLFAVGFLFEAVGDAQLVRFKRDPANRGEVLDRGLWRYSRHPNYFGDATLWWGLFLFALAVPGGWRFVASPLLMTFLLLRVSGVTLLERDLSDRKPAYRDYVRRTPAFVPWFPKVR